MSVRKKVHHSFTSPTGIELLTDTTLSGWLLFNDAVYAIEALSTLKACESMTLQTPAGLTPSDGDLYIIPEDATGVWEAHKKKIGQFKNGRWTYYTPLEGTVKYVKSEGQLARYVSSSWTKSDINWS